MPVYRTIEIKPNYEQKWNWKIIINFGERVKTKTKPNGCGFYHYCDEEDETAFGKLKKYMINQHKKEIRRLQFSLKQLEELEFNHGKTIQSDYKKCV